jgi:hypothetical protein
VLHRQKQRGDAADGRSDEMRRAKVEATDQRRQVGGVDGRVVVGDDLRIVVRRGVAPTVRNDAIAFCERLQLLVPVPVVSAATVDEDDRGSAPSFDVAQSDAGLEHGGALTRAGDVRPHVGTTAVASISTFARSSNRALTTMTDIAG